MKNKVLPFHLPSITEDEAQSVANVLRSGWLTTGPMVKQFEIDFAKFIGTQHAIAVNSATSALHLALDAIGVKENDEVIVPTWTFTATAAVVVHCQARPVLVDCEKKTLNLDPKCLEKAITPRTKAIIPVHFAGQPCEMKEILDIAKHHHLMVVEDAAHALPARYKGKMVGTIGDITCFSFYPTKTMTTGEGGMSTTDNPEWAKRMRMMSLHGISEDAWLRYSDKGSWAYEVLFPGYKYNMTDIAAALGLSQLKKVEAMRKARAAIVSRYNQAFSAMQEVEVPTPPLEDVQHAWHIYALRLVLERLSISRNQFIKELKNRGVSASVHFIPLHLHPYYQKAFGYKPGDFPVADWAFERSVSLPLYPDMTNEEVHRVIETVEAVIQTFRR